MICGQCWRSPLMPPRQDSAAADRPVCGPIGVTIRRVYENSAGRIVIQEGTEDLRTPPCAHDPLRYWPSEIFRPLALNYHLPATRITRLSAKPPREATHTPRNSFLSHSPEPLVGSKLFVDYAARILLKKPFTLVWRSLARVDSLTIHPLISPTAAALLLAASSTERICSDARAVLPAAV
jgi:hypothetical protein